MNSTLLARAMRGVLETYPKHPAQREKLPIAIMMVFLSELEPVS